MRRAKTKGNSNLRFPAMGVPFSLATQAVLNDSAALMGFYFVAISNHGIPVLVWSARETLLMRMLDQDL